MRRTSTTLRGLLGGSNRSGEPILIPVAFDALTARIAERIGFHVVALGGPELEAALGVSEGGAMLEDIERMTRYATNAVKIPVIVDAGHGFGHPARVRRAIRELEAAGAAGAIISDQASSEAEGDGPVSTNVIVERIRAAAEARTDGDLVIVARLSPSGKGADSIDALARKCRDAGADILLSSALPGQDLSALPACLGDPAALAVVNSVSWNGAELSAQELGRLGYRMVFYSGTAGAIAARAEYQLMTTIKETGQSGDQAFLAAARKNVEDLIGLDEMYQIERDTVERASV